MQVGWTTYTGVFTTFNSDADSNLGRRHEVHDQRSFDSNRCHLKGAEGDAIHAVLCRACHNISPLLKKLVLLLVRIWQRLMALLRLTDSLPLVA